MQKVLTSRNYCFLNPPINHTPLEDIKVNPNTLHEGELRTGTQNAGAQGTEGSMQENTARRTERSIVTAKMATP